MNDPQLAAPTLLTLTAPKRRETASLAPEPGFAEELEAAIPAATSANDESAAEVENETPAPDPSPTESEGPPTEQEESSTSETPEEAATADDLLVVSVAVETLVLETPPGVQLPDEATTTVDISLNTPAELAQPTDGPTAGTASLEGVEASALAADAASIPASDLATTSVEPVTEEDAGPLLNPTLDTPTDSDGGGDAPYADALATVEAIEGSIVPTANAVEIDPGSVDEQPNQPLNGSSIAPVSSEGSSESGDEQDSETTAERSKPVEPLPPTATASTTEVIDQDVDPATERAPLPNVGSTSEARSTSPLTSTDRPSNDPTPAIDPTRFVSRVARAFDLAQERGGGPIEIRLSPPELGSMQVKIEVKEGVMTASLDVETPAARNALLDNLPALRDRLEQQQIRIDKFDVDVRDDGQRGGDWQPSDRSPDERSNERREPTPDGLPASDAAATESDTSTPSTIHFGDDAINLVA